MSLFKNRSFNVKLVNDKLAATEDNSEPRDPVDGVLIAQAYAQIATETIANVAQTVVAATVIIVSVKTGAKMIDAGLKYLTK